MQGEDRWHSSGGTSNVPWISSTPLNTLKPPPKLFEVILLIPSSFLLHAVKDLWDNSVVGSYKVPTYFQTLYLRHLIWSFSWLIFSPLLSWALSLVFWLPTGSPNWSPLEIHVIGDLVLTQDSLFLSFSKISSCSWHFYCPTWNKMVLTYSCLATNSITVCFSLCTCIILFNLLKVYEYCCNGI